MKLGEGRKFTENKTWLYFIPYFRFMGEDFLHRVNSVYKIAFGIYDDNCKVKEIRENNCIFMLIDYSLLPYQTKSFLEYIRNYKYYVTDYPFERNLFSRKIMIVLRVPYVMEYKFNKFVASRYSEIWDKKEREVIFNDKKIRDIIDKTKNGYNEYIKKIDKLFSVKNITEEPKEYELPLKYDEEVFNYKGKNTYIEYKNFYDRKRGESN